MAALALRVDFDLITGLGKVKELVSRLVSELYPILSCGWRVVQLDDCRAACHNVCASWQEITATDHFEHATLSTTLATDDDDLGHLNGERHFSSVEDLL